MRKYLLLLIVVLGALTARCSGAEAEPVASAEPNPPATPSPLPAPVVTQQATDPLIATTGPTEALTPTTDPTTPATAEPTVEPTFVPVITSPVSEVALEPIVSGELQQITFLTHAFDDRLFVLEQVGRIRIVENGQVLAQPFLDITDRVGSSSSEQGLLGLAFHPDYATLGAANEGVFFVNYTDKNGNTRIARYSVSGDDPNTADPTSEIIYLTQEQPYPNHNGGSLAFGPDGYLYAGLGDGGSANDPLQSGQDLSTLLGKVLRLDVDAAGGAFTIPDDNPFVGVAEARPEIWAYGLRNPWRFSFDRATGDFYIADVGQNTWEEVNMQPAPSAGGENYGWNIMEGSHCFRADSCDQNGLVLPIFDYDHSQGCSVTGGYVYRGQLYPALMGNYFVSDYCTGTIWRVFAEGDGWISDVVLDTDLVISSFGEDANGELYVLDYRSGGIFRLTTVN